MTTPSRSVAFRFVPQSFVGSSTKLMGFQSANRSLLEAVARYGSCDRLIAYALDEGAYRQFEEIVRPFGRPTVFVPAHRTADLRDTTLLTGGADLGELVWARRYNDPRAFSVVGVVHAFPGGGIDPLPRWFTEPYEAWDAVVCTSQSTRTTLDGLLDRQQAWLSRLHGSARRPPLQLPVLPLGIHADRFEPTPDRLARGKALRQRLGIPDGAVVLLHLGRLSWLDKANPFPMFHAAEVVARTEPATRIDLVLAGWTYDAASQELLNASAARWCPSVRVHQLDGLSPEVQDVVRAASDIFVSLVDNVQETFGLAPVEAMAAGLPCLVADWDGYRDTVRHGEDGLRVPTRTPPSGAGTALAAAFPSVLQISAMQRSLSQCTEVDLDLTVAGLRALVRDPALRARFGESARRRALEAYDWSVLVPRYEAMWADLAQLRATAPEVAPRLAGEPVHPLWDDPFDVYAAYPTDRLGPRDLLTSTPRAPERLRAAFSDPVLASGVAVVIAPHDLITHIVELCATPRTFEDLVTSDPAATGRAVLWLAKIGALRIASADDEPAP